MRPKDIASLMDQQSQLSGARKFLNSFLFDLHSLRGKITNAITVTVIMVAVILSMLNTIDVIRAQWGAQIETVGFWILVVFAIEHVLRIYSARDRWHYIRSFDGIVDSVTVLPLFIIGDSYVLLRLLRLARVIKIAISFPVVRLLFVSLKGSLQLLVGVLGSIGMISVLVGNIIFILEPQTFANAFEGTWWSLVTMSTVGYGDFVPQTPLGKALAATLILSGICMFAMVTAVISVKVGRIVTHVNRCISCGRALAPEYTYCPHCAVPQSQAQPEPIADNIP